MLKLCDDIDTMAMVLLDGELADQELRDMELHLLGCAACKDHVAREEAAHQRRRQRLAAPPAPDVLRMRIGRALDEVDRARRPAVRAYVLPVGAALAAVAALVVFVASSRPPSAARDTSIAATSGSALDIAPAKGGARLPQLGQPPLGQPIPKGEWRFQFSGYELLSKDVARLHYAVLTPETERVSLVAIVATNQNQYDPQMARLLGGYQVWVEPQGGIAVRDGDRVILVGSNTIAQDDLWRLIRDSLLILRIGNDDPRR